MTNGVLKSSLCGDAVEYQLLGELLTYETASLAADIFKALADSTQLKIIELLLKHELYVHTIADLLGVSQSAISHQLRMMRQLRLVGYRKEGRHVFYRLDDEHVHDIIKSVLAHLNHR
ncbi:MAG: metalloregulator ArsR/SmtB family transcription factor [bacterium]|nr:metalloregulator ArsR/SmtB family transcription factor [bacterium]